MKADRGESHRPIGSGLTGQTESCRSAKGAKMTAEEEWEKSCTCHLGWNNEGKRCVIHFDRNCPFHYPDSELAQLKERYLHQQQNGE